MADDDFGLAVAVSGDATVIGARSAYGANFGTGAAYVFRFDGTSWSEEAKLYASDGVGAEEFGISVAFRDDVTVIGAKFDDDNGPLSGSAYVFKYDGSSWNEEVKLLPSDGETGDHFGESSAMSGNLAIFGAPHEDANGPNAGAAYIFGGVCPCPWDLDGDGSVGATDLLGLLVAWGTDPGGPPDFDGEGNVGSSDLLALLFNWGLCPCVQGTPPLTLEEELADACLSQADWDEFEAVMTDPESSQAQKDNYLCWMEHYLFDCNKCICIGDGGCPDDDPFN